MEFSQKQSIVRSFLKEPCFSASLVRLSHSRPSKLDLLKFALSHTLYRRIFGCR